MTMQNEWIENTGTVPDGVGPDTPIDVEYECGKTSVWENGHAVENNDPDLWAILGSPIDVIRWRFLK